MIENSFRFFTRIANSITNFDFYRHIIHEKTGRAVSYLLLLTFLLGIIVSIRPAVEFNQGISLFIDAFEEKIPDFILENGELTVQGNMPIIIEAPGSAFIIDTSGQTDEQVINKYENVIFISKHKMVQKNFFDKTNVDFRQLGDVTITKDIVKSWLPLSRLTTILVFLFVPVGFIAFRFFTTLLLSIIGLAVNSATHTGLTFGSIFKLSAYAITLPILLVSVLKAGAVYIPGFWIIYMAIGTAYLWKALSLIKSNTASG
ncbi:MAG: DUF1189 domain-containing protein [Acetivibrionales bacterium]